MQSERELDPSGEALGYYVWNHTGGLLWLGHNCTQYRQCAIRMSRAWREYDDPVDEDVNADSDA
ncbi:MAG TPA: hypothetical protein VHK27_07375, partial [Gammaproteobacteria bacterium]|nr:hypothetical protein [Gammaproteobacteria bacterium]